MTELILLQLPRTAQGSLVTAFASVGVTVRVPTPGKAAAIVADAKGPVAAVLRHPVDRLESHFNLRLRSGRPHRPEIWSDWEAAMFTVLSSFNEWGEAMCSHNEFLRSASDRAFLVLHKQHRTLIESFKDIRRDQVHVAGTTDDLPDAVQRLSTLVGCDVPTLPTDPAVIDATPDALRVPRTALAEMGLRIRMAEETDFYEALLAKATL